MKKVKNLNYLVVIDMQNDFLSGPLGNDHTRRTIGPVLRLIKEHINTHKKPRIFFTQDTHDKNYLDTLEGKRLPVVHCQQGTEGQEIIPEIDALCKDVKCFHVTKTTFGSSTLRAWIWDKVKEDVGFPGNCEWDLTIDICGVCTSICVLANAVMLREFFPDAIIRVHKDACGDVTKEAHEAALKVLEMQQCDIVWKG